MIHKNKIRFCSYACGSTTDGFYQHISDGDTWPKILSESLTKYKVINGGVGGYDRSKKPQKFFLMDLGSESLSMYKLKWN